MPDETKTAALKQRLLWLPRFGSAGSARSPSSLSAYGCGSRRSEAFGTQPGVAKNRSYSSGISGLLPLRRPWDLMVPMVLRNDDARRAASTTARPGVP